MSPDDIYYRLDYSGRVLQELEILRARAIAAGHGTEVLHALRVIQNWLRADPRSLGEPTRDYSELRLTEFAGSYGPIAITYTVHWDLPLVFVGRPLQIMRWAGF